MPQKTTGLPIPLMGIAIPRRARQTSFPVQRKSVRRRAAGQHDCVRTAQRSQRLPQSPGGKQAIANVLGSDQHNIEIAGQRPVLKTVVEQVELRPEFLLGKNTGRVALFSHHHRNSQTAREQQRFVSEITR